MSGPTEREGTLGAERVERRLAAILAADVAGYSRLDGRGRGRHAGAPQTLRRELIDPKIAEHKGRIVKTTGDGMLIEFPSVVEAVACAVAVQQGMAERNAATPRTSGSYSASASISATSSSRTATSMATASMSRRGWRRWPSRAASASRAIVHDQVQGRLDCAFDDLGEQSLKNIARPVRVYRVAPKSPLPNLSRPGGRDE